MRNPLHAFQILLFSTLLFLLCGCGATEESRRRMDRAESLMETAPDSALAILDSVSPRSLLSGRDRARHALLKSMALDKNYIDTITFDVLQPAIDYYLEKGSPDERLRTLYYQGRIFENRKNEEEAMKSFINATEFDTNIKDSLVLGHVYTAKGFIYYNQSSFISSLRSYLKGADIYRDINRIDFQADNLLQALDCYIIIQDRHHSDSILRVIKTIPRKHYETQNLYLRCKIVYARKFLSPMEIKELLDTIQRDKLSDDLLLDVALGYVKAGDKENAMNCLKEVSPSFNDRVKYLGIKSEVEEINGEYKQALSTLRKGIEASDSIVGQWTGDDRLFAESKYELEKKISAGDKRVTRTIFISIIIILALCTISLGLLLCFSKVKIKVLRNEKEMMNQKYEAILVNKKYSHIQKQHEQVNMEREDLLNENHRLKGKNRLYENEIEALRNDTKNLEVLTDAKELLSQKLTASRKEAETLRRSSIEEFTLINELIAHHITNNDKYLDGYKKLSDMMDNDREEFLINLRKRFQSIYPDFMAYLDAMGLSEMEQNYVCLYAIGLRPQEIGEYLQSKRYYIVSSEIRMKFGLGKNDMNLGAFIKDKLKKEG